MVVFNGEIYNYRELAADLRARGHVFKTESDTEVLAHLYEEEGPLLCERLRGMFAFALWDSRQQCLLLARDRFGKKPLYYARTPCGGLVFSSGGVDSSVIAYEASRLVGETLRTFTVAMGEAAFDESPMAVRTARALGVQNTVLRLRVAPLEELQRVVRHYDQPYADSSAI